MGSSEEDHRGKVPFSSYYRYIISPRLITLAFDCDHLTEVLLSGLSPLKLFLYPPFPNCTLWKEVAMHRPHLKSRVFHFFEGRVSI